MKKTIAALAVAVSMVATVLIGTAEAATTPEPTSRATMIRPGPAPNPTMDAPQIQHDWQEKTRGKEATFTALGPAMLTDTQVKALWTSNVVSVKRGRTVGRATLKSLAAQFEPLYTGNSQRLRVRFTDKYGKWQKWRTVTTRPLSVPPPTVPSEKTATFALKYPGPLDTGKVRMQVELLDNLLYVFFRQELYIKLGS